MKVLFISKHKYPHIGGVERHIREVGERIEKLGHSVTTISEENIKQPNIKIIGLLYIWFWFLKNIQLIKKADIVHIHDVFVWYLPFRFLFPRKKVYITFHGWEGKWPIRKWAIFNKRIADKLTNGSIAVGKYIEKYYGIKANYIIHGATTFAQRYSRQEKIKNSIVWLGRTDQDTGYFEFLEWIEKHKQSLPFHGKSKYVVKYITNVKNPEKYLKTAEYCVPSGYLSYLEAKSYGCKIITFANNPLKEDYWNEIRDIYDDKRLKAIPTWDVVTKTYIKLWQI